MGWAKRYTKRNEFSFPELFAQNKKAKEKSLLFSWKLFLLSLWVFWRLADPTVGQDKLLDTEGVYPTTARNSPNSWWAFTGFYLGQTIQAFGYWRIIEIKPNNWGRCWVTRSLTLCQPWFFGVSSGSVLFIFERFSLVWAPLYFWFSQNVASNPLARMDKRFSFSCWKIGFQVIKNVFVTLWEPRFFLSSNYQLLLIVAADGTFLAVFFSRFARQFPVFWRVQFVRFLLLKMKTRKT